MPAGTGCGHYTPNHDYAAQVAKIKEDRQIELEGIRAPCEMCNELQEKTSMTIFGGSLPYYACSDVVTCDARREASYRKPKPIEF